MGDCQSKNESADVSEPTIESRPQELAKQKPENGRSFGENCEFCFFFNVYSGDKREVISIHIGQAGVQIGNSCWELFCLGMLDFFNNPSE